MKPHSKLDELLETPLTDVKGNQQASQWYTTESFRDYWGRSVALITRISARLLMLHKVFVGSLYVWSEKGQFFFCQHMSVVATMMSWAKRKQIPMKRRSFFVDGDDMSPINGAFFSADQTKWSLILFAPPLTIMPYCGSVLFFPSSFAAPDGGRIGSRPFSVVLVQFDSVLRLIGLLPNIAFGSFVTRFAESICFVLYLVSSAISTVIEFELVRPHTPIVALNQEMI